MNDRPLGINWIEIIRVRLFDAADDWKIRLVFHELIERPVEGASLPFRAGLFKSTRVPTDWSIHLVWREKLDESNLSPLGSRLFWSIQDFGIVGHAVWEAFGKR